MIAEPIINARFKHFRDDYGLTNISDGDAFEKFTNWAVISTQQPDAFNADSELFDTICVGGMSDTGIDGMAIKINNVFVRSIEDVEDVIKLYKRIDIEYIFIQSKYKPEFKADELGSFIAGVKNFFFEEQKLPINGKIQKYIDIKNHLISDSVIIRWNNEPQIKLYFVAMGRWRGSEHIKGITEISINEIKQISNYDKVEIAFIDSDILKNMLNEIDNRFSVVINTIAYMDLTAVDGVENSCIALISGNEYVKLLCNDENNIRASLFDDNVRDYLGENSVNSEIIETIKNEPAKFILFNNGVTIVCDRYTSSNRKITIENPKIVNGCQTSHVLFKAYKEGISLEKVPVSARIISTIDDALIGEVVRGTNRQTIVLEESFEATKKFHKDLEKFFIAMNEIFPEKIYYERRTKQYSRNVGMKQYQKINLRILVQYFVGMFLNFPHLSHKHESILLSDENLINTIFLEKQSLMPYYITSYSFYLLEKLFRENNFYPALKPYKAHLLMLFRESILGQVPNINNETSIDKYCADIASILKDDARVRNEFNIVAEFFNKTVDKWTSETGKSWHVIKDNEEFTKFLLKAIVGTTSQQSAIELNEIGEFEGKVINVFKDKYGGNYGFIKRHPDNIFFHSSRCKGLDFTKLEGVYVRYKTEINLKRNNLIAVDVRRVR